MTPLRNHRRRAVVALAALLSATPAYAQLSLQSAVDLALKNSPRIRAAQADRAKAVAAMQEARDAYIPVVVTQGGYGQSTGAPLSVPVVFSISAQSLGFSFQQRDNLRATRLSIESADHALARERGTIVQDVTNTYVSLSNALERQAVLRQQIGISARLSTVVQERVDAGIDAKVELPKAHRTNTQLRLVAVQLDSEVNGYQQHLAAMTGVAYAALRTVRESIPAFAPPVPLEAQTSQQAIADDEGVQALAATARAKQFIAFADSRYLLRPQVGISAYYSRVYTGSSSYLDYYPCFDGTSGRRGSICYDGTNPNKTNSENALGVGFQLTLPLLDYAHRAKARGSEAEAIRAAADVEVQRQLVRENRERLRHSTDTLVLRTELAREDQEIAQDQLETVRLQLQSAGGTAQLSPKDELNAQLQERQRFYDLLLAQVQLQQTQLNILQQSGDLGSWVGASAQATPTVTPFGAAPTAPGTPPAAATPGTGAFPTPGPH